MYVMFETLPFPRRRVVLADLALVVEVAFLAELALVVEVALLAELGLVVEVAFLAELGLVFEVVGVGGAGAWVELLGHLVGLRLAADVGGAGVGAGVLASPAVSAHVVSDAAGVCGALALLVNTEPLETFRTV